MPQSAIENILAEVNNLSSDDREALIAALTGETAGPAARRRSAYGKYAGLLTPVEEFLRIKHQETDREDSGTAR